KPTSSAELYIPWETDSAMIGNLNASRDGAAGAALRDQGALLIAGGTGVRGTLSTSEALSFVTLMTDRTEYQAGMPIRVSGTGWRPGEKVQLKMSPPLEEGGTRRPGAVRSEVTVNADASGAIFTDALAAEGKGTLTIIARGTAFSSTALASANVGAELDQCA